MMYTRKRQILQFLQTPKEAHCRKKQSGWGSSDWQVGGPMGGALQTLPFSQSITIFQTDFMSAVRHYPNVYDPNFCERWQRRQKLKQSAMLGLIHARVRFLGYFTSLGRCESSPGLWRGPDRQTLVCLVKRVSVKLKMSQGAEVNSKE